MSSRITFRPSGHQFVAEAGETVLSAALRAGLSPRYNCDNGSCGECRARVLAGPVGRVDFHDYALSAADKLAGVTLLCRTHADGDLELEAQEASDASEIPQQCIPAKLTRLQLLNERAAILHVRAPRSRVFRFLAGQHVQVRIGGLPPRELPVASCPCNGLHLQFHLLRDDTDPLLRHIFTDAKAGDAIELLGPMGDFVLDEDSSAPLLFVAWEDGFAPINSLIEHAIALELPNPITLFWAAGDRDGLYLESYCRSWADALDNFTFVPRIGPAAPDLPSVMREQLTSGAHPDSSEVYAAVLPAQSGPIRQLFESIGIPSERLHIDEMQ